MLNQSSLAAAAAAMAATAIPAGIVDEPLYVNAKQYHRILKRRVDRARLEARLKLQRERVRSVTERRGDNYFNLCRNRIFMNLDIVMLCVDLVVQVVDS